MRVLPAALALFLLLFPAAGRSEDNAVVVELFTSQGCSSCPPADELLTRLAEIPGVVALALHVDYWDYLGWEDSFASPRFTKRQRAYAKRAGSRSIYTPMMVLQGQEHMVGHDEIGILRGIAAHRRLAPAAAVRLSRDGSALRIAIEPKVPSSGPVDVHVARFVPADEVFIEAGENAGRSMTYSNIVTDWVTIGQWDGTSAVELSFDGYDGTPTAVILQRGRAGPVLSAAVME